MYWVDSPRLFPLPHFHCIGLDAILMSGRNYPWGGSFRCPLLFYGISMSWRGRIAWERGEISWDGYLYRAPETSFHALALAFSIVGFYYHY
jgi:hypothetical protein